MIVLDRKKEDLVELFSEEAIQKRIAEIAKQINADYPSDEPMCVICVLKGAVLFACDLIKHIDKETHFEFKKLESYGNSQSSSGEVKSVSMALPNLNSKNVLVVEDIVDTGLTAKFLLDYIQMHFQPKMLKLVALLNKKCARVHDIKVDYYGFEIDNKFVVGYGLDYMGYYRNLPYIGYFPQ